MGSTTAAALNKPGQRHPPMSPNRRWAPSLPFCLPLCSSLFATHYHGLTQEPALAALVQLGHMEAAVDPWRGLLPSYRLAPGGRQCGLAGMLGSYRVC